MEELVKKINLGIDRSANYQKLYDALCPSFRIIMIRYIDYVAPEILETQVVLSVVDAVKQYTHGDFKKLAEKTFKNNMAEYLRKRNRVTNRMTKLRFLIEDYESISAYRHNGLYDFENKWQSRPEAITIEHEGLANRIGSMLNKIDLETPTEPDNITDEWREFQKKKAEYFKMYG